MKLEKTTLCVLVSIQEKKAIKILAQRQSIGMNQLILNSLRKTEKNANNLIN